MNCSGFSCEKCDEIKEDKSDGNTESFLVGTSNYAKLVLFDSTTLGVTDYSKIGEETDSKGGE